MFKNVEILEVFLEALKVGRVIMAPERHCLFEYDQQWLKEGFSISPFYLPLKSGVFNARIDPFNGLFGVFNDSLPDGWGQLLIDRWFISKRINPSSLTFIDMLSIIGNNGMGALSYLPAQNPDEDNDVQSLDFYASEIEKILRDDYSGSLEELVCKAGSSGGAQPKVMIKIDGEEWIVKFRSSSDPVDVGKTEYEYSLLAKKCGLEMTETRLLEGKYFGTRRFDRDKGKRLHVHSASGLLYASHRLPSLDYTSLIKATFLLSRDIKEVEKMFRLMVFNVLIGNKDDHSKNFSFIYRDNRWQVSPAYDLLPSYGFNNNHTTTVNGKGNPSISDCMDVAKICSFPLKMAARVIQEVHEVIKVK